MGDSSEVGSRRNCRNVVVAFVTGETGPAAKLSEEFGKRLATAGLDGCVVESWGLSNISPPLATSDAGVENYFATLTSS